MKKSTAVLAILILLGSASLRAAAGPNLVQNGDMETGDLTLWNVSDPNTMFASTNPHAGSYAAWLGSYPGTGVLSQDLTTVAGQQYQIDFFVANDYLQDPTLSSPSALTVSFGGTVLLNQNPVPYEDYTEETAIATAVSSTTTLSFSQRQSPGYLFLDDVSVKALETVPELNGTLAMGAMLSLCGLVLLRRHGASGRKNKNNFA